MAVMTKRKALSIVLLCAVVLLALLLLRWLIGGREDLRSPEGRQEYLEKLGWEIAPATEEHRSVLLPERLDGVIADYNRLQLQQGFDLSRHLGERCEQYSYLVLNYPDSSDTVVVTLYLQGKRLIAGDVHSTAMDGFMEPLKSGG